MNMSNVQGKEDSDLVLLVSQKLPFQLKRRSADSSLVRSDHVTSGFLATLAPVAAAQPKGFWLGWPGTSLHPGEEIPESLLDQCALDRNRFRAVVSLEQEQYDSYERCCRDTLVPLLHSMPDKAIFEENSWDAYKKVNDHYALEALRYLQVLQERFPHKIATVILLDFHLLFAANELRKMADKEKVPCNIGLFCHAPFPAWDTISIFPWIHELLQGILSCDLVCFHQEDHSRHFLSSCQLGLGCRVDPGRGLVEHGQRASRVQASSLGIDFKTLERQAKEAAGSNLEKGIKVILSAEYEEDVFTGLENRLLAFERLLEEHPEQLGKVQLILVTIPSSADKLENEVHQLVEAINKKFSTSTWSPIKRISGLISRSELRGLCRDADVGLFTPLRAGSSLLAKEFVASRVRPDDPGVLVLSNSLVGSTASVADSDFGMREALTANPYSPAELARVMERALSMPAREREARMHALRQREQRHDLWHWTGRFLSTLRDKKSFLLPPDGSADFDAYLPAYLGARRPICLLLDYDGTLSPIVQHPDLAVLSSEMRTVLQRLADNPDVFIAVVSGRSPADVEQKIGIKGKITYAGNHGLQIFFPDGSQYHHPLPQNDLVGLKEAMKEVCREGAWLEDKGILQTFHYREVAEEKHKEIADRAKEIILERGYKIGLAHCALECFPKVTWNKGTASILVLQRAFGDDWSERIPVLVVGDDVTDEDAFSRLKGIALSFRIVGSHITHSIADKRIASVDSVLAMLKWVDNFASSRAAAAQQH